MVTKSGPRPLALDGLALAIHPANVPGRDGAKRFIAELVDATGFGLVPFAVATFVDLRGSVLDFVLIEFVMVPDWERRRGYGLKLVSAIHEHFGGNVAVTDAVTDAGEKLVDAYEREYPS